MARRLAGVVRELIDAQLVGDEVMFYATPERTGYVVRGDDGFDVRPVKGMDYQTFSALLGRESGSPGQYLLIYAYVPGEGYRAYLVQQGGPRGDRMQVVEEKPGAPSFALCDLKSGLQWQQPIADTSAFLASRFGVRSRELARDDLSGYEPMRPPDVRTLAQVFAREWSDAA